VNKLNEKIVIIGSGIAAVSAIKAIREIDKESKINLYGDEKFYPYTRIKLTKVLLNSLEEDKMLIQKKDWYSENNIDVYINKKVVCIDTDKKQIELSDGERVEYTKLLLANGSRNMTPPLNGINKEDVFTLRTIEDARNIVNAFQKSNTILIIGGGILSLELAWVLSQAGKKIIVSEILPRLMPRQLDEIASSMLQKTLENQGVEIILNNQISEVSVNENGVEGIINDKGKFTSCDMITYSIGIKPNIDIVNGTIINANRGVIVNNKMETNVHGIYAAGDVAEHEGRVYGLWNIAIGQGTTAGYNIAGKDDVYKRIVPVTMLNAFNISLFSMGNIDENTVDTTLIENEKQNNCYKRIFIKDNKVVGSIVINNSKSSPILKKAIEGGIDLEEVDLKNISIDELLEIIKNKN
jgi:nitrite reductase (NADH) large subunit